jgi:hypothetical protein
MDSEELISRLYQTTIDYDGSEMPDGAEPIHITCGLIREIIRDIRYLNDQLDTMTHQFYYHE